MSSEWAPLVGRKVVALSQTRFEDDNGEHDRIVLNLDDESRITLISQDAEGYASRIKVEVE